MRYKLPIDNVVWEIDIFTGVPNCGIAEVELASVDQVVNVPDWVIKEVTEDVCFTNAALSLLSPYEMIQLFREVTNDTTTLS